MMAQELRVAIGRVARRLRQRYASAGGAEASFTEVAVLARLNREGQASPGELADMEHVTSQAIAAVMRDLEHRRLVTRAPDPGDRRRVLLSITAGGRGLLRDREQAVVAGVIMALEQACSAAERRRLQGVIPLLDKLADAL